jgi:hypothetical protein
MTYEIVFNREATVVVEADSEEEIEAAAKKVLGEVDQRFAVGPWDYMIYKAVSGEPTHTVVEGEIALVEKGVEHA